MFKLKTDRGIIAEILKRYEDGLLIHCRKTPGFKSRSRLQAIKFINYFEYY